MERTVAVFADAAGEPRGEILVAAFNNR